MHITWHTSWPQCADGGAEDWAGAMISWSCVQNLLSVAGQRKKTDALQLRAAQ